jgi:hypothetical protein
VQLKDLLRRYLDLGEVSSWLLLNMFCNMSDASSAYVA